MKKNDLVATFYPGIDKDKKPGILLLSGSDGGMPGANAIPETFIQFLVENGYAVLALAYFGVEGLPANLENIPLEYFETAIHWLRSQPQVNSQIGLIGQSRGAELALLLGATFRHLIQTIVASAPCDMICGGFPHPNRPAWTFRNRPIAPFLHGLSNSDPNLTEAEDLRIATEREEIPYHANTAEDPYVIADLFLARKKMPEAQIPVENIKCPILLLSGDQDAIWPSRLFCESIANRSSASEHINYPNAGHGILASFNGPIYHPMGGFWCKLGGTPEGNQTANNQSWTDIRNFLRKSLHSFD
ncbi:MAG: hypothetical protein K1X28_09365 [Parachlamydiales bacterium]|nr:hypothetical protein [Parachlamydiales bacterium]